MKNISFSSLILILVFFFTPIHIVKAENESLIDKAWQAFIEKDTEKSMSISEECIIQSLDKARQYQYEILQKRSQKNLSRRRNLLVRKRFTSGNVSAKNAALSEGIFPQEVVADSIVSFGYKELNDVGTACFIQAEALRSEGREEKAKEKYSDIVRNYPDAYLRNSRGWFLNVAGLAQDRIDLMGTGYDYEDYNSGTLARKGWLAFKNKDKKGMELYVKKCIDLYEEEAKDIEEKLKVNQSEIEIVPNQALTDVASAYFILGEKFFEEGKEKEARDMYSKAAEYKLAQCWDPKGWYWKVSEVSQDKLDTMGTPYNFEDYKSATLTNKAWDALNKGDYKGVDLYAKKCIYLYEGKAKEMQKQISDFAKGGFIPYFWALNDVAVCYFILGEGYRQRNDFAKAKEMYQAVIDQLGFAQCWDLRGMYWKVAEASKKRLNELK